MRNNSHCPETYVKSIVSEDFRINLNQLSYQQLIRGTVITV